MTRGKYAAKANGQRAETATNTANSLRAQLEAERAARAAETADLKSQINTLAGRLERDIHTLAADEVARAHAEARQTIEAERADARETACAVMDLLGEDGVLSRLTQDRAGELADLLGLDRNEVFAGTDGNRQARRITKKKMRYADSLIRSGHSIEDLQNGAGVGMHSTIGAKRSNKVFAVGGEVASNG